MDIKFFEEFIAICEYGSFEKAADELFISQSSLSKHIKKAETELATQLFDRSSRKIQITHEGELLFPYAKKILSSYEQYLGELHAYSTNVRFTLNIGSIYDISPYRISDIIAAFQQQYPNIQLNISCEGPFSIFRHLNNGTYDLAFLRYAPADDLGKLVVFPFTDDKLVAICSKQHPLASREVISISSLANEKLLGFPPNTFMHTFTEACFQDAGFQPNISLVAQRTENQIALASHGLGIGLSFRKIALNTPMKNVAILDIDPPYSCKIDLCYVKDQKLSFAAQKFIHFVKTHKSKFIDS